VELTKSNVGDVTHINSVIDPISWPNIFDPKGDNVLFLNIRHSGAGSYLNDSRVISRVKEELR